MNTKWRRLIAAAILVIVSLSTIAVIRSTTFTGSDESLNLMLNTNALSITLLVAAVIKMTALFYIIANAPSRYTEIASQHTIPSHAKVYSAAPVVPKVKSHPLPPLWR